MQTYPTQITDVIYNASSQSFEALVTVYDAGTSRRYACAIKAPMTMSFETAAKGLQRQAQRQHDGDRGLRSFTGSAMTRPRAGRPAFDPVRWLEGLLKRPDQNAA
ncbi:orotidine 5-phosphate decarboxylase [Sulfitobacter sp. JB4-11]|uniref:orotidine 5-phosphate decarboxylase n=1 Tax=Sulfitobacter rhodophyticola TaxID=3238304 RepID=UPI0035168D40